VIDYLNLIVLIKSFNYIDNVLKIPTLSLRE